MLQVNVKTRTPREHAVLGLQFAVEALADAERSSCGHEEILGLCNEVIMRRLRLHDLEVADGRRPSAGVQARMARDRLLLQERAYDVD